MAHYNVKQIIKHKNKTYICQVEHDSDPITEPGVGVNWENYWGRIENLSELIPVPNGIEEFLTSVPGSLQDSTYFDFEGITPIDRCGYSWNTTGNVTCSDGKCILSTINDNFAYLYRPMDSATNITNKDFVMTFTDLNTTANTAIMLFAQGKIDTYYFITGILNTVDKQIMILCMYGGQAYMCSFTIDDAEWSQLINHTYTITKSNSIYTVTIDGNPLTKGTNTLDGITTPIDNDGIYYIGTMTSLIEPPPTFDINIGNFALQINSLVWTPSNISSLAQSIEPSLPHNSLVALQGGQDNYEHDPRDYSHIKSQLHDWLTGPYGQVEELVTTGNPTFSYINCPIYILPKTPNNALAATGKITVSGTPVIDQTLVIDIQTFLFKELRSLTGEITISSDNNIQAQNIVDAINTDLSSVDALIDNTDVNLMATIIGSSGNSIVFTTNATGISVSGSGTLTNGFDLTPAFKHEVCYNTNYLYLCQDNDDIVVNEFTFDTDTSDSNGNFVNVTGDISAINGEGVFNLVSGASTCLIERITEDTDLSDKDFKITITDFRMTVARDTTILMWLGGGNYGIAILPSANCIYMSYWVGNTLTKLWALGTEFDYSINHTFVITRTNLTYAITCDGVPLVGIEGSHTITGEHCKSNVGGAFYFGDVWSGNPTTMYIGNLEVMLTSRLDRGLTTNIWTISPLEIF